MGRSLAQLGAVLALLLVVPPGIHGLNSWAGRDAAPATYLPALEGPRERGPFEAGPIGQLAGMEPGFIVIGDSMAGTRVDPSRLEQLSGEPVAPLLQAGSGPVYWYLALKNWVIPSGAKPKAVLIFFRDTNLTDVMFRLDDAFRWNVDRVAGAREEEVNALVGQRVGALQYRLRGGADRLSGAHEARRWMPAGLEDRLARALVPSRRERVVFLGEMNRRFQLEQMRPFEAADVAQAVDREADFDAYIDRSVLPLMLRDAQRAGLTLGFVRVQRRPVGNRPPEQSEALRRYIARLREYIEARGAIFHDDTGDPMFGLEMYADGDHVRASWRTRYTEILYGHLAPRLR